MDPQCRLTRTEATDFVATRIRLHADDDGAYERTRKAIARAINKGELVPDGERFVLGYLVAWAKKKYPRGRFDDCPYYAISNFRIEVNDESVARDAQRWRDFVKSQAEHGAKRKDKKK